MKIHLKSLVGAKITLDVDPRDTINDVKQRIQEDRKVPVDLTPFIYAGKLLEGNEIVGKIPVVKATFTVGEASKLDPEGGNHVIGMDTPLNDIWADLQALQDKKRNIPAFEVDGSKISIGNMTIEFMRTLRIPLTEKEYPLPPCFGFFRPRSVNSLENAPRLMKARGGVVIPVRQSEAMLAILNKKVMGIQDGAALQIFTGTKNAISGETYTKSDGLKKETPDTKQNYVKYGWIDGFSCSNGYVRQFTGPPLKNGLSVEKQILGKDNTRCMQLVYYPLKVKDATTFSAEKDEKPVTLSPLLSPRALGLKVGEKVKASDPALDLEGKTVNFLHRLGAQSPYWYRHRAVVPRSGVAAGGKIKQNFPKDTCDLREYDTRRKTRIFVHLVNAAVYTALTKEKMPHSAVTSKKYADAKLPWLESYGEHELSVQATSVLQALKAFKQLDTMKVSPSSGLPFDDEEDAASGVRQHGERGYYSKAGMHEEKEAAQDNSHRNPGDSEIDLINPD